MVSMPSEEASSLTLGPKVFEANLRKPERIKLASRTVAMALSSIGPTSSVENV